MLYESNVVIILREFLKHNSDLAAHGVESLLLLQPALEDQMQAFMVLAYQFCQELLGFLIFCAEQLVAGLELLQLADLFSHELDLLLQEKLVFSQNLEVLLVEGKGLFQVSRDQPVTKSVFNYWVRFDFAEGFERRFLLRFGVLPRQQLALFFPCIFIEFERLLLHEGLIMQERALLCLFCVLASQNVEKVGSVPQSVF